jgi:hypothetical protein
MRGSLHLLTPVLGAAFLSLIASGRSWARPSWQRYFGVTPDDIEAMREAAREVLGERELSREELVEGLVSRLGFEHLDEAFRSGWGTLFKPLAWQGDLCFGAPRGNRVTFVRPEVASPGWRGVPDPDDAAPLAIGAYLRAYGPATIDNFGAWLAGGWFGQRRLRTWFGEMGDQLAEVDVEGRTAWVVREDLEGLLATRPKRTVRLLPGFDAWVLGPGTADPATLPAHRRTAVSRQAGWISPIVVVDGVVSGTWQFDDDDVRVAWFEEAGRLPRSALVAEVERLAGIVGRELRLATETVP